MTTASFQFQNPPTANLPGLHLVTGRFDPNSDGNETPLIKSGKGFTLSNEGTGITRVTFGRRVKIISVVANVAAPSPVHCVSKKVWDADVNYVDFITSDYDGNIQAVAQSTEQIEFIAIVMAPATSLPDV